MPAKRQVAMASVVVIRFIVSSPVETVRRLSKIAKHRLISIIPDRV
jgi:hypothetical protein